MAIKDLFGKTSNKLITAQDAEKVTEEVESKDFVREELERRKSFVPRADFNDPKNFVRYGSAERYYVDSIENIYKTYPYDGSESEQISWHNSASYLDNYLFESGYPRTTGHVQLNSTHAVSSTIADPSGSGGNYKLASSPQYISFKGGPHRDFDDAELSGLFYDDSRTNVYDVAASRSVNLDISHDLGNTVEFWYKVDAEASLLTQNTCVFDMHNDNILTEDDYGRIMVEILGTQTDDSVGSIYPTTGSFSVSYLSGSTGVERMAVGSGSAMPENWAITDWHHYAFVFESNSTEENTKVKFYVDGELITENSTNTTAITSSVTQGFRANIGAYREAPIVAATSSVTSLLGYGTYEDSYFDEFRFWKKARTDKEIKRNWFKQVRGGTNSDNSNLDLGVYYKFNEGIIGTSSINITDKTVLDYSGRISNGTIENYTVAVRSTASALGGSEYEDPIIYSTHPRLTDYKSDYESIGQAYDIANHTSIMGSIPAWITDIDEQTGATALKNLIQIMSSYFDTLHLQIEALPTLKDNHYPTMESGSYPYHFIREAVGSMGIVNPDLFIEANVLEELSSRDEVREYTENIQNVKNVIYQNIYNSLPHIFKSKGTEKSFRNLIRCFGIDSEILKLNMYANDVDVTFEDNSYTTAFKKQYVNFNNTGSFGASVYQFTDPDNSNSATFMKNTLANADYIPYTMQCEIYFPKKYTPGIQDPFYTPFTQSSLFGLHEADHGNPTDLTWTTGDPNDRADDNNFQVYFIRNDANSKHGHFKLEYSGSVSLTSSNFTDVYDNEKWNLAVRLKPSASITDIAEGSGDSTAFQIEFFGVNVASNIVQNEFMLTASISAANAKVAVNSARRIYVGAHRTNFTGSVLYNSDVNISSVRFWNDDVDNRTIRLHAKDATTHGRLEPYKPAFFMKQSLTGSKGGTSIPQIETLALHWGFNKLTGSDGSGEFIVDDLSSGSFETTPYAWYTDIRSKFHTGKAVGFPTNYSKVLSTKYISTLKSSQPEVLNNSDMVNVLSGDDEVFTRDSVPIKHYFAAEKSMYQNISDEMLKTFAGLTYFNDLVGAPVNRYRLEYKNLRKLRQLFFQGVDSTPDLEKYVEFYKWIDSAVGYMLQELYPASANSSDNIRTMVESHILERNKYWNKFPTIESKDHEPTANMRGVNELLYDWEHGHKLISPSGVKNVLFNKERAIRTADGVVTSDTSGNSLVNAGRESLREIAVRDIKGNTRLIDDVEKDVELFDNVTSTSYEASTYATRRLSKPYRFAAEIDHGIKGGVNFPHNKLSPFDSVKIATNFGSNEGLLSTDAVINNNSEDGSDQFYKFKADSSAANTSAGTGSVNAAKGSILNPFSEYTETVVGSSSAPVIVNNLFDTYGKDKETPMQGTFTSTHVGGAQHRHIDMNRGETPDTATSRPELYVDAKGGSVGADSKLVHPASSVSAKDTPSARYYRDELAKRSVNIRNINYATGSFTIGNYRNAYEIVSAGGRSNQKRWLVKNEGNLASTGSTTSDTITELKEWPLADRTRDKNGINFGKSRHIISERFSAPGGTDTLSRVSLDAEHEEFSPYNSLNYRNLIVRNFLNTKHRTHSGQQGYVGSETDATGSFHKIQRNAAHRLQLTGSTQDSNDIDNHIVTKAVYDNFFITHMIPRSEYQYSWITSSALPSFFPGSSTQHFNRAGYSTPFLNVQSTASFVLSGSLFAGTSNSSMDIDFVGLNTTVYDPISFKHSTTGYPNSADKSYIHKFFADSTVSKVNKAKELNALLLHRSGPYQFPSWKQVRVGERTLARKLRQKNIISVKKDPELRVTTGRYNNLNEAKVENYFEPPVSFNKPIETRIKIDGISGEDSKYRIRHSYSNSKEMFANPKLTNATKAFNRSLQPHDKLVSLYTNPDSEINFTSIDYSEFIYPKHRNVTFKRTRQKMYYAETEGTLRKSPGVIRTFWRDERNDRIKPNRSSNALDTKFSIKQIDFFKQLDSFWALDNFEITVNSNTYEVLGDLAYVGPRRYNAWISNEFRSHEQSPDTIISSVGDFASANAFTLRGSETAAAHASTYRNSDYVEENISTTTDYSYPADDLISRNKVINIAPDIAIIESLGLNEEGDSEDPIFEILPNNNQGIISTDMDIGGRNNDDEPGAGGGIIRMDTPIDNDFLLDGGYILVNPKTTTAGNSNFPNIHMPPSELDIIIDEEERPDEVIEEENITTGNTAPTNPSTIVSATVTSYPPRPAIQFIHNPYHSILAETGWDWNVSNLSGKKPWYDLYENYNSDIRKMGQNYSVIPEFAVSKHMKYYVKSQNGNFNVDNYAFLTLDGAGNDAQAQHDSALKRVTFKKSYSRDGFGAFDIDSYPTASGDDNLKDIQNNAWYEYIHPDGNASYTDFRNFNNVYASGTFDLDNSILTLYNVAKTGPTSNLSTAGSIWKSVSPFQTRNAAVMMNSNKNSNDYLVSTLEKVNTLGTGSISLQKDVSDGDPGTSFCVSYWVTPSAKTDEHDYAGGWNLSMGEGPDQWIGMWHKCPKASDWGGTTATRGLTVFMSVSGSQPKTERDDASVMYDENIYEFFNEDGTEATLATGETYHVVFQFTPQGNTGGTSPAYVRLFLNGEKLFGKHIKYANADTDTNGIAYSACPLGADSAWDAAVVYGDANPDYGFNRLDKLEIGKANPSTIEAEEAQLLYGTLDEFSMWSGILDRDDVTRMNLYGQPSNLIEEYANEELNSSTGSWAEAFGIEAGLIGADDDVSYTRPVFRGSVGPLELFQWSRLGAPFTIEPQSLDINYDDDFFDHYCHTDVIKHFDKITTEHENVGTKTKLKLKVNAVKKLLPYNGFYPSQRTAQLAYLFKDSYKDSIAMRNPSPPYNTEGLHISQGFQSFLQPFFAPGLLFNTIKSGIAVDFPIFTNDSGLEPSRPFPIIDAFQKSQNNEISSYKLNLIAPSWYCTPPKDFRGRVTSPDQEFSLALVTQDLEKSQPKYTIDDGADSEGFVIIKEPSARLDFEKLLDVESAFFTEGSLNHKLNDANQENKIIFQNTVIEFRGFECEENTIVLRQPIINNNIIVGFQDKTIHVKHMDMNPNQTKQGKTVNEATIYLDFLENDEFSISSLLGRAVIDYINQDNTLDYIAVDSGLSNTQAELLSLFSMVTMSEVDAQASNQAQDIALGGVVGSDTLADTIAAADAAGTIESSTVENFFGSGTETISKTTTVENNGAPSPEVDAETNGNEEVSINEAFRNIEPGVSGANKLGIVSSGHYRIKIIYTGPLLSEEAGLNKRLYVVNESNTRRLDGTLFSIDELCVAANGLGFESRISVQDSGKSKQVGVYGLLGIRYVNSAGSVDSDSDATNYTPMLQNLRPFYGGRQAKAQETGDTTSLGSISIKKKPHQIFFMAPTYYTGSITTNWTDKKRYPFFEWTGKAASPLYKMAMHNFLAETPKFFLKNEGMTTIASSPQNEFKRLEVGKKYYMDVIMYSKDLNTTVSPYNGQTTVLREGAGDSAKGEKKFSFAPTQGRYYGPPSRYKSLSKYEKSEELIQDPAYAPYTPPYFYGRTIARVYYTADKENPSIDDIHKGMEIDYIEDGTFKTFIKAAVTGSEKHDFSRYTTEEEKYGVKESPAFKAKMKLEASINFKGKTRLKNITYDVADPTSNKFSPVSATDSSSPEDDVWIISPKFECPILNYNPLVTNNSASIDFKNILKPNDTETKGTGLWHGYGKIPANNEGLFLSIEESFKSQDSSGDIIGPEGEIVGSLINACGFRTEVSKLGEIASERKISEAVIMIPFIDVDENGTAETISVINKNLFKINKEMFNLQKTNVEKGDPAIKAGQFGSEEDLLDTSISKMIKAMKKYNIPPKLDFVNYNKDPFVMYIFEFNHTFDQEDLSDIWQGVSPKIGRQAKRSDNEDDNEIVHDLGPYDFFGGQKIPSKVRWLVFKVKQKGEKNYYNVTADSKDDDRFKFDFKVGKREPEYSYNWPYDFFSLVELVNIEGGVIIESDEDE